MNIPTNIFGLASSVVLGLAMYGTVSSRKRLPQAGDYAIATDGEIVEIRALDRNAAGESVARLVDGDRVLITKWDSARDAWHSLAYPPRDRQIAR